MDPSLTLGTVLENLSKITIAGGMATILYLSYRGVWMWTKAHLDAIAELKAQHTREYERLERDRDEWKQEAKASRNTLKQAAATAETLATVAAEKK